MAVAVPSTMAQVSALVAATSAGPRSERSAWHRPDLSPRYFSAGRSSPQHVLLRVAEWCNPSPATQPSSLIARQDGITFCSTEYVSDSVTLWPSPSYSCPHALPSISTSSSSLRLLPERATRPSPSLILRAVPPRATVRSLCQLSARLSPRIHRRLRDTSFFFSPLFFLIIPSGPN